MGSDGNRRGPWSQSEDRRLLHFIREEGPQNWVSISHEVGGRSAKQCRERYHQNLRPGLNHSPITELEADYIIEQVALRGPRWAEISRELNNNRSDNAVKNWWNGHNNRAKRLKAREEAAKKAAEAAKASQEAKVAQAAQTRPQTREAQRSFLSYGPAPRHGSAPLPSPTDPGFSPRPRETALPWSRDPLPPSPSSVVSDHSISSRARFEAAGPYPPPRYHAHPSDSRQWLRSPPGQGSTEPRRQTRPEAFREHYRTYAEHARHGHWAVDEYEYGLPRGYWDRPSSPEGSRSSSTEPFASYQVPRSQLRQSDERQYYHSHQLPRRPRCVSEQSVPYDSGETRECAPDDNDRRKATATRVRDERMSVSALMD